MNGNSSLISAESVKAKIKREADQNERACPIFCVNDKIS
jgi:hypothetical protein